MIGLLVLVNAPYFNVNINTAASKLRPHLIIGQLDSTDYTALPLSTIYHKTNVHKTFDLELNPETYPFLNIKQVCFVRVHKSVVVNKTAMSHVLCDVKKTYSDLFVDIMILFEDYCKWLLYGSI